MHRQYIHSQSADFNLIWSLANNYMRRLCVALLCVTERELNFKIQKGFTKHVMFATFTMMNELLFLFVIQNVTCFLDQKIVSVDYYFSLIK